MVAEALCITNVINPKVYLNSPNTTQLRPSHLDPLHSKLTAGRTVEQTLQYIQINSICAGAGIEVWRR